MAGNGVPPMSTNNSVPSPYMENPLVAVLKGFQQFQASKQQKQLFDVNLKQTQAQTIQDQARAQQEQVTATQQTQTFAQQQFQQLGQRAISNKALAQNPQVQQQLRTLAQQAGMPDPFAADGSLDPSVFQKPIDVAGLENALQYPAGPVRDGILGLYSGVPSSAHTDPVSYDGKVQSQMLKVQAQGIHWANSDDTASRRAAVMEARQQLLYENNPLVRAELQSRIKNYDAQANRSNALAQQGYQQAALIGQEVQNNMGQWRAMAEQYRANPNAGLEKTMVSTYSRVLGSTQKAKQAMASADAAYQQAFANGGGDPDDPATQAALQNRAKARAGYQQAVQTLHNWYDLLQSQQGSANRLKAGMGAKSVSVGGGQNIPKPPDIDSSTDTSAITSSSVAPPSIDPSSPPKGAIAGKRPNGETWYNYNGVIYGPDGTQVSSPP